MTDPTHADRQDQAPWRLALDEGERLEVRLAAGSPERLTGQPEVVLAMPAWRAADLGRVMDAYTRIAAIFTEASQVNGVEASLARALGDAAAAARGEDKASRTDSKVEARHRLRAMAVLQEARPELSHSKLISIIDAAAWWLHQGLDDMALELLTTVEETVGTTVCLTLLGRTADGCGQAPCAG